MGLLKETMRAIIHIDQNLNRLCNPLAADTSRISKEDVTQYKKEFLGRVINSKEFDYPANLTLGGRFAAIREYRHLKQHEVAQIMRVTPSYVSRFESDKAIPSESLIRLASQYFNIDEHWLAMGELPQKKEEAYHDLPKHTYIDYGHPTESTYNRVLTEKEFCYPDSLTFGGRLKAVRMFNDLTQTELGDSIGVTFGHISNLEKDVTNPSAMLIRAVSRRFNIDEQWLATGELPQTTDEPATPIAACKVTPLSGYGYGDGGFPLSFHESEKLRTGYTDAMTKGFDYGDPAGDRTAILTQDDLKKIAGGKPLLTPKQMEEQMKNLTGFYSQTPQSKDTAASDR